MKICPRCSTEYPDDTPFCTYDGERISATPPADDPAGDALVGQVVADRYRVLSKLGLGGFGEIFLVEDTRLDRRAVMKVLMDAGPSAFERLRRESGVPAKVMHPAFARVFDLGQLADGRPYLVTEWVPGRTLHHLLRDRGRLSLSDTLAVGLRLAGGLARLHEVGILHRDIKPSNVAIPGPPQAPAFGEAKLLDFGVFGELIQEGAERVTRTGFFVGTPRYMAPEQVQALPQSPATDVYGLALLMVEMLYGGLPFERGAASAVAILVRIVQTDLELPEDPAVPESLRALLARSLSRDPTLRPAGGAAFAAELETLSLATGVHRARTSQGWGRVPELASPRAMSRPVTSVLVGVLILATLAVVLVRPSATPRLAIEAEAILWIAAGIVLAVGGVFLADVVRRLARSRLHLAELDTGRLLLGVRSRGLSDTVQVEVRQIITRCRELDERLLGITILKMIGEYDIATASDDRQAALMNVATLLEKLRGRLSPWYARLDKQLALATTLIGVASGLVSIVAGVVKIVKGEP